MSEAKSRFQKSGMHSEVILKAHTLYVNSELDIQKQILLRYLAQYF